MGRGSILSAVVAIGALAMATAPVTARQEQKVAKIEKVKDNLYVIIEGGGNTAAFITANGVVVVDTKLAGWGQAILDQIKTVTPKPVISLFTCVRMLAMMRSRSADSTSGSERVPSTRRIADDTMALSRPSIAASSTPAAW